MKLQLQVTIDEIVRVKTKPDSREKNHEMSEGIVLSFMEEAELVRKNQAGQAFTSARNVRYNLRVVSIGAFL